MKTQKTELAKKEKRVTKMHRHLLYFFLPIVLFLLTSLPGVGVLTPFLAIGLVVALLIVHFVPHVSRAWRVVLWILLVLSLIGSTGWFYSPFFFALYLCAVALGFIYTPGVAIVFTIALIILFAFSVGEVNVVYDFLTLLSLLSVIPLTLALRKSFLLVQQERKGILILEEEQKGAELTTLDAILANRINRIGILLRQPITYLKQGLAMLRDNNLNPTESKDVLDRMQRSSEELFTLVKQFEQGTTNNDLLTAPPDKDQPPRP